ncbi:hypothetical protein Catovirus_2_211 [Catovirus CTV1]|uniref:Putative poly(A) polymerase catalytic subunit n=1 Tax=Catovirus CTV1 TaxID=1977631 RepID=A0A1V0SC31_9VIRU|nr:hypothetical protein Catovirus_2_211 [Catovirus CTV1]
MSLYKEKDIDLLKDNIDKILDEVEDKKMIFLEPYASEIKEVSSTILQFVKDRKRKIYGGFAINMLIKKKDAREAIYKDKENPDIDFYSPEPIKDLIDLCNILYDKGFKFIRGYEAQHKETYSIRVNNHLYCDISYVPKNIYNKIPFDIINDIYVISPHWYSIDFLRMMTDPLTSYWRIDKHFQRFFLIQKHYPFPNIDKPINVSFSKEHEKQIRDLLSVTHKFLEGRDSTITVGFYAYDHFLKESTILKQNNPKAKKFKLLEVPYYEIISTNFRDDSLLLISKMKELIGDIEVVEHYPYFQFLGHSVYIYYQGILICIIYHYNKKCLPFIKVSSDIFNRNDVIKGTSFINIGTFSLTLMYALMTSMKAKTDNDNNTKSLYYTFISHLLEMRKYYFEKTGKNMLSGSIFKDFVLECKGYAVTPEKERALLIESRKKKKQRPQFAYDPSDGKIDSEINYVFANSSGNPINNPKNLKLVEQEIDDDIQDVEEVKDQSDAENNE